MLALPTEWGAVKLNGPLPGPGAEAGRPWVPVPVPGHWQLSEGFAGHEGYVLYRCAFAGPAAGRNGGEVFALRFGGVYYAARVWLNGAYLGSHEGYFAPFEFDCTDVLRAGTNELLVEVNSPHESGENDRQTLGGVWAYWDGMDPRINPGGIFRPVELVRSGPLRIRSLGAEASPSGQGHAVAEVYATERREVSVEGHVRPLGFRAPDARFTKRVPLEPGPTKLEVPFRIPEPRLWWTRDRGEQHLYELTLRCAGEEKRVRFGVRSVELRGWNLFVNGERIFLRGINYLPTDVYPARTTPGRQRRHAARLAGLGLNAVRVHAHVAERTFYEACDELGLLIFQDFPLQWTHRRSVLGPAIGQAREMAGLLRNHPSVGLYLAHDEPFYVVPPEKWRPLGFLRTALEAILPRWALWQRRVLGAAVVRALGEEDPTRPVIEAAGHPLTTNHLYFGWYYGRFRDLERAVGLFPGLSRLPTEYGAQALPHPDSLAEFWPDGAEPDWRNLSDKYRLQRTRMDRYVGWKGSRELYVRESQAYQAEVLKHATELFRRRKYRPTGGTFAFMFNDPTPAVSWSVLDWRGREKAGYEAIRKAMAPVLVCARYPKASYRAGGWLDLPVFVVNDLPRPLGRVRWGWTLDLNGAQISRGEGETEVPADGAVRAGRARAPLPAEGNAVLRLWLDGADGAENTYGFAVTPAAKKRRPGP